MTVFLPTPGQALVDPRTGHLTATYRRWANALTEAVNAAQGGATTVPAEPASFVVSGAGSVTADGSVAGGEFVVTLVGDRDHPLPTSFYGMATDGAKGYTPLSEAIVAGTGILVTNSGYTVVDTVATPDDLPLTGNAGEAVLVTDSDPGIYAWDGSAFTLDPAATGEVGVALDDAPSDGNTYGRKDGGWGLVSTGGGMSLMGTATVSGSAATDLTLSGLDLAADGLYRIFFVFKNATASLANISMLYNSDTTATNYYNQFVSGNGATPSSGRANSALITGMEASTGVSGTIDIVAGWDGKAHAIVQANRGAAASVIMQSFSHAWTSSANVTGITISSSVANALGIGSYFKVFKVG